MLKFFKKLVSRKRRGETILEVIMALFIVALGSATATSLIVNAMQSNGFSRDNLIALNLAVEGLEAVRNIRDTNWLKFGYDKKGCWNAKPGLAACTGVSADWLGMLGLELTYSPAFNPQTMQWGLTQRVAALPSDLTGSLPWCLYYNDLNKTTDSLMDDDAVVDNDRDIINDYTTYPASSNFKRLTCSGFYRGVSIKYTTTPNPPTEMTVTSLVQWKSGTRLNSIKLSTKLTNYLKVKVN